MQFFDKINKIEKKTVKNTLILKKKENYKKKISVTFHKLKHTVNSYIFWIFFTFIENDFVEAIPTRLYVYVTI